MKARRNPVYDIVKFVVLLMVVRGHLEANGFFDISTGPIINMSIGAAMPLFFMISGYFSVQSISRGWGSIIARITSFLWPLAAFGAVFGFVMFLIGKFEWWKALIYPVARVYGGSWFLPTLAIIYGVCAIVMRALKPVRYQLLVLLCLYVVLFFTADQNALSDVLRISSVLDMMPYFVFGMYVLRKYALHEKWQIAVPCGILFVAVSLIEGNVRNNGMGFYWVPKDWQTVVFNKHLALCFFGRTIVGITGSVFLLWFSRVIICAFPKLSSLAVFGTTTLGVYVIHQWPLIQIHKYYSLGPLNCSWKWPMTIGVFLVCHYITVLIRGNDRLKLFFFGDEKWLANNVDRWLKRKA